ncbi:MAG: M48 family metallopeptidase [Candidatus Omnitrophica bacterium]|nr:M48 family metallopeptidase [Candidatus Omnitrophota bacterium]
MNKIIPSVGPIKTTLRDLDQSKRYHQLKNRLYFFSLFIDVLVLLFIFFSGYSQNIKLWAQRLSGMPVIFNGLYLIVFSLLMSVVHFPMSVFSGFYWEHRFQLSNQSFTQWFWDDLKKTLLGLALVLVMIEFVYFFLAQFPDSWWLWAGAFWLFISFVIVKITPHFIIPLFYKYKNIEDEELRQRIFILFKNCQVSLNDIYAIDMSSKTKAANAFLCGMGRTRRVVLSDTLISNFSIDEIESVVAHELGHYKHHDILRLLAVNTVVIFSLFYMMYRLFDSAVPYFGLTGIDDISFFPVFILTFILVSFLITPALNAFSRLLERDADLYGLQNTTNKGSFVSMMNKLGEMNLAEKNPSPMVEMFFYDHPPVGKRIAFAQQYVETNAV